MKRFLAIIILSTALTAPAFAQTGGGLSQYLTQENIGRGIGAIAGGLLGNQIGSGSGNKAAIAAGAVGGYILGGKIGRDWNGSRSTGYSSNTGYPAYSSGSYTRSNPTQGYRAPLTQMPVLDNTDGPFVATHTSNVRGGPGSDYVVVDNLYNGETVRVLGRVVNTDWYMVAQNDVIKGFVHDSLLQPMHASYGATTGGSYGGSIVGRSVGGYGQGLNL